MLRLGTHTVIVASSPITVTEILKTNDRILSGRYVFQSSRVKNRIELLMVWSDCNENWKLLRRMCRMELFLSKMIETQSGQRKEKLLAMVKFLKTKEGEVANSRTLRWSLRRYITSLGTICCPKTYWVLYMEEVLR
ncbi:putative (S)-N-methylcoclaurine 3'-hydroxylase isozyme 2 [Acorus gramineus]|uniref:(S)-N-methylcoclaurine 3'-hydroxylase isozyme 2 n=1 Tax=Acorus gramineus TaxID=55184 RepID=A0AAV9A2H1_ACOGR|nr:putative (S)-N-methylcoclaurine 3'-hydroxylase isozyme 2 [Acorus gramineus]